MTAEPPRPRAFASTRDALRMAVEEELSGAGFFAALATAEPDPRRAGQLRLLELMEVKTAAILRPAAAALRVDIKDATLLWAEGAAEATPWKDLGWHPLLDRMLADFPPYLDEFTALAVALPPAHQPAALLLHDHEVAILAFARAERDGTDGTLILTRYLDRADAFLTVHT